MPGLKLGDMFYERAYADAPEMVLINRFLEVSPTNQIEQSMLLSRYGSGQFGFVQGPPIRAMYSDIGLFNGDLFFVNGNQLWRYNGVLGGLTAISGFVANNGFVHFAPQWGGGAGSPITQALFISDGQLLQYYDGGTHATGTLTVAAGGSNIAAQVVQIGTSYYTWGDATAVESNLADGSSAHPWVALLNDTSVGGASSDDNSLGSMANLLMFNGTPGVNFSVSLGGPSIEVTAVHTLGSLTLQISSIVQTSAGDSIATVITSGSNLSFSNATLTNGGIQALNGVQMPNGVAPKALAAVSSYVLVSVANSQIFYYIEPGEQTIDPLNFNAKQSNPDNIVDMVTMGDQVIILGDGSTENWYPTGNADDAFAPYEGRVFMRGVLEGTTVLVKDSVVLVGNDGIVYSIGYQFGTTAQWGVNRISTHGIEERIRTYLRQVKGLTP